ncbi:hypothetical protein CPLU01_02398 [Colletotrichum plurivorum]|uniref:Longiborneol synthase n=1 Tax=Colletotrichum plurivorum TaxID=2175906 RepID=A0A8H6KVS9_9PEZI|nr:hypothetical protein CPLU01_02398 [Colletotrichum plurivorum]
MALTAHQGLGFHTAASSLTSSLLSYMWGLLPSKNAWQDDDLAKNPERLASIVKPICTRFLGELNYPGAPQLEAEAVEALLQYMYKRALAHPRHPTLVQGYVGLFTWLVVQYDDIIVHDKQMMADGLVFHQRFFRGEPQANNLLEGIATLLREAHGLFDSVLANMLQLSVLKFLTSNLLERHEGFQSFQVSEAGIRVPYFYRDMSGMDVAYSVFCYPKEQYSDVSQFLEAIPDMAQFINLTNDVLSFYKEEVGGDNKTYINNVARTTKKPAFAVFKEVYEEAIGSAKRIEAILEGRGVYADTWKESVRGYLAMHTTSVRYKLEDLDLAEEHPLKPIEGRINEMFNRAKRACFGAMAWRQVIANLGGFPDL